ncbi:MAG: cysteine--tRNA ligase [Pseudomonadota bacterium]|nr:cysteine--tRNA ligase [Pseudomonadota bacterium]
MNIFLFDSLSRKKKEFIPINPKNVRVYACGPTVYDFAHVGNARMAVVTDLLVRILKKKFERVTFVSNITDIDDKIIKASKDSKIPINLLTNRFHKIYNQDMANLNVKEPDLQPKATEHINEMIQMIKELINNKCAYISNKNVIFNVESYRFYGKLSGRSKDEQMAGARVEVADFKKNPRDFILWKPSKDNEPGWSSPWGRGRPGWHIECSAMSRKCLETPFDIHCGGVDLTFPHHENEIAQSCSARNVNSKPEDFCRYWFHNGFVTFNGEKMSKSLGNIQLINDLLNQYDGETIRLSLISSHYRQPLNWTKRLLEQSKKTLSRIYNDINKIDLKSKKVEIPEKNIFFNQFMNALCDDLNTPKALSVLNNFFNLLKKANAKEKKDIREAILNALAILGINENISKKEDTNKELVEMLVKQRDIARKDKDFKKADEIREKLKKMNIDIEDTADGTRWKK